MWRECDFNWCRFLVAMFSYKGYNVVNNVLNGVRSLHILLEKAYRYHEPKVEPIPSGCTFMENVGYWTVNANGAAMMLTDKARNHGTKKADRETGEDQKGE